MNETKTRLLGGVRQSLAVTLILMLICGLLFPVVLTGVSALLFPRQAGGSLVEADGRAVGARYVGQEFTADYFMKSRPSAYHYNTYTIGPDGGPYYLDGTPFAGLSSGSNNYGPSNPALVQRVEGDIQAFLDANPGVQRKQIPADLLTASGSGLDPHISPLSASIQIPALARASGLSQAELEEIVAANTTGRALGIFGGETVNVMGVNLDIAQAMGLVSEIQK